MPFIHFQNKTQDKPFPCLGPEPQPLSQCVLWIWGSNSFLKTSSVLVFSVDGSKDLVYYVIVNGKKSSSWIHNIILILSSLCKLSALESADLDQDLIGAVYLTRFVDHEADCKKKLSKQFINGHFWQLKMLLWPTSGPTRWEALVLKCMWLLH